MPIYDEKYLKTKVREHNGSDKNKLFRKWSAKRKYAVYLHRWYYYWFHKFFQKSVNTKIPQKFSTSLFRRV